MSKNSQSYICLSTAEVVDSLHNVFKTIIIDLKHYHKIRYKWLNYNLYWHKYNQYNPNNSIVKKYIYLIYEYIDFIKYKNQQISNTK